MQRDQLEKRWLSLTREEMPSVARARGWPVVFDHCFQRILLDNAAGRVWYEVIEKRPAYRHAPDALLRDAVELGEAALDTLFHQLLMSLGGWAQFARYELWRAELAGTTDETLIDLLSKSLRAYAHMLRKH